MSDRQTGSEEMRLKLVVIDFDGVVHDYKEGWQDGVIYGDVVPGFFEWCQEAFLNFKLVIYSSRSKDQAMRDAMQDWLSAKLDAWYKTRTTPTIPISFSYAHEKPPGYVTIDDRAIQFRGDWSAPELSVEALQAFRPWNA